MEIDYFNDHNLGDLKGNLEVQSINERH